MPKEIEGLLEQIDTQKRIEFRMYKYHCVQSAEGLPIKDPTRLGRNSENILFIDYDKKNVHAGFENTIELFWKGSKRERKLLAFSEILGDMFRTVSNHIIAEVLVQGPDENAWQRAP